jgi:3-hydroxymyristoyl/3-hydroxydecanoyl-(acyl carrier protein) dehydratase
MSDTGFERMLCIDVGHPALPGHFPGQPLVPGVVLLEQVALALHAWRGQRLARVLEAKFVAPLLPAQPALVRLTEAGVTDAGARIRFEIQCDGNLLARGMVEGAA